MSYKWIYDALRNSAIDAIADNATTINSNLASPILGYVVSYERDDELWSNNGDVGIRTFNDPVCIVKVVDREFVGYPAIKDNWSFGVEAYYNLSDLTTETLLDLCEII